jgi:carbon-monoxide dehydrogenase medium subunit
VIRAADFFVTYLTTSLEPGEILTELRIPNLPESTGWAIQEVARRHGDFAIVGAAATLRIDGGRCVDPRIVVFGASDKAARCPAAEAALAGQGPDEASFARAGDQVADALEDPTSDVHASSEYRRDLARVLTRRVLVEAAGRAG